MTIPRVAGFSGYAGSGKDAVAGILTRYGYARGGKSMSAWLAASLASKGQILVHTEMLPQRNPSVWRLGIGF